MTAAERRPQVRLADIIAAHGDEYRRAGGGQLPACVERTLHDLRTCRTFARGARVFQCHACGQVEVRPNSCGNRHCPQCTRGRRAQWLERQQTQLLPVPYFQAVFTLPHQLSQLTLANRKLIYGLLFRSAAQTLLQIAADPRHLGAKIGFQLVLHTWGQQLEHHPHVHAVLPGGGLSPDGSGWIACDARFFLPTRVLSPVFRGKFLGALQQAYDRGKLCLAGPLSGLAGAQAFRTWLNALRQTAWVVHVEPPPQGMDDRPECLLKYLARYVSGIAISESRLLSLKDGLVRFLWKDYRDGRQKTMTLSAVEFLRRFSLHVLPPGFVRIRSYGLLHNRCRVENLELCRTLIAAQTAEMLSAQPTVPADSPGLAPLPTPRASLPMDAARTCPFCKAGQMQEITETPLGEFLLRSSWLAWLGDADTS